MTFDQVLPIYDFLNYLFNAFWMDQLNGCVHYMKIRMNENSFQVKF